MVTRKDFLKGIGISALAIPLSHQNKYSSGEWYTIDCSKDVKHLRIKVDFVNDPPLAEIVELVVMDNNKGKKYFWACNRMSKNLLYIRITCDNYMGGVIKFRIHDRDMSNIDEYRSIPVEKDRMYVQCKRIPVHTDMLWENFELIKGWEKVE